MHSVFQSVFYLIHYHNSFEMDLACYSVERFKKYYLHFMMSSRSPKDYINFYQALDRAISQDKKRILASISREEQEIEEVRESQSERNIHYIYGLAT